MSFVNISESTIKKLNDKNTGSKRFASSFEPN